MWKRLLTSRGGWSYSRACQTLPSVLSKNSRYNLPWVCPGRHQRLYAPEVKRLTAGSGTVSAARGDPTALPSAVWTVVILYCTGGIPDGTGTGGAAAHAGPERTRPVFPLEAHRALGATCIWLGELVSAGHTWSRALPSTILSTTVPRFLYGMTLEWLVYPA